MWHRIRHTFPRTSPILKTSLDHLPRRKQTELKRVVDVLFAEFDDMLKLATSQQKKRGRILKIILYGSYARGDWVDDRASGYMSDYDLLIIVNQRQLVDKAECWEKADDWFASRRSPETQVHFFVETLHEVNDKLAQAIIFSPTSKGKASRSMNSKATRWPSRSCSPRKRPTGWRNIILKSACRMQNIIANWPTKLSRISN